MATTEQVEAALARADATLDESLERLFALLRIPSISTEAAHRDDCSKAADWLVDELKGLGFDARAEAESSVDGAHPAVVVDAAAGESGPVALFYGHYDVQPVDPLALWSRPPFEPAIETEPSGRKVIRARGASDDKGQVMTFIEAVRAWRDTAGGPPIRLKFLIEGEEEAGSPSMGPFVTRHKDALAADLSLICDTEMWSPTRPAITTMLRGMALGDVTIRAANRDLHSGAFGSAARNPNALLVRILSELRDEDGRVTLDGFYDGVPEPSAAQKAAWDGLDFDPASFLQEVGLRIPAGEDDRSVLEQIWSRPTAEINGIFGGYTGDGFKTVIPSEAHAKVSFRLVGDQDPAAVWSSFEKHVRRRLPHDCVATFRRRGAARPVSLPVESAWVRAGSEALHAEWGATAALKGGGGSIPVVEQFQRILGIPSLLIGYGQQDDQIHSPNEKYDLESFRRGVRSWIRVLGALADAG